MSEKHMENNIDDIFRQGVDPLLTEPSDEFWKKASENIISRGSQTAGKRTSRWKAVTFILAAGLIMLGYITYRIQDNLKNIEKQIAITKGAKNTATEKVTDANTSSISTTTHASNSNYITRTNSVKQSYVHKPIIAQNQQPVQVNRPNYTPTSHHTNNTSQTPLLVVAKPVSHSGENKLSSTDKSDNNGHINPTSKSSGNKETDATTSSQQPVVVADKNLTSSPTLTNQSVSTSSIPKATTQTPTAALPDSATYTTAQTQKEAAGGKSSRFSVSAFFSPNFMTNYKFTCNAPDASLTENSIKREKEGFSYVTGANVEYALSSTISVSTGIGYSSYKFSVPPCDLYAEKQTSGDVGYSMVTSSGLVNCPSYGNTWPGDTLRMNANATRTYISIPLQLKYYINGNSRFRFYIEAGIQTNIAIGQTITMDWQDAWKDHGTSIANYVQGSEQMYFTYDASIGMDYKLSKYFSIYAEPGMSNAITPIDKGTVVVSYPRQFNVTAGLTYHF